MSASPSHSQSRLSHEHGRDIFPLSRKDSERWRDFPAWTPMPFTCVETCFTTALNFRISSRPATLTCAPDLFRLVSTSNERASYVENQSAKPMGATHQCRRCGYVVPIDDIDPRVITLGVITCPKCEMSGPVNIAIIQTKP